MLNSIRDQPWLAWTTNVSKPDVCSTAAADQELFDRYLHLMRLVVDQWPYLDRMEHDVAVFAKLDEMQANSFR